MKGQGGREGDLILTWVYIPGFVAAIMSPGCPHTCDVAEDG